MKNWLTEISEATKQLLENMGAARVWVYQANRELTNEETCELHAAAYKFTRQWHSHKEPVQGTASVFFNRFLIIAAAEQNQQLGGCSIDSTVHFVKELGAKYNIDFSRSVK